MRPKRSRRCWPGSAGRRPEIPAEFLVRHVLAIVPAHEWPVRVEAMDALLRRLESARKDELRIEARPEQGKLLGLYATRRRGSESRPYQTVVTGVDPIAGPLRLPRLPQELAGALQARPRRARASCTPGPASSSRRSRSSGPRATRPRPVRWDPIRPLLGFGDWLERVTWEATARAPGARAAQALGGPRMVPARPGRRPGPEEDLSRRPRPAARAGRDLLKAVPSSPKPAGARPGPAGLARARAGAAQADRRADPLAHRDQRAALKGLKRPLYPYQRDGVERFLATGRLLLADDMGLGKTAQAIACCDILWRTGRVRARPRHRAGQPQAAVGARVGRTSPTCRSASSTARPPSARPSTTRTARASSSSTTSSCSATSRSSAAGTPTSSCSTRPSGSRTGRPRRRSRSRA